MSNSSSSGNISSSWMSHSQASAGNFGQDTPKQHSATCQCTSCLKAQMSQLQQMLQIQQQMFLQHAAQFQRSPNNPMMMMQPSVVQQPSA